MTTTNRSFIKAYRQDAAEQAPVPGPAVTGPAPKSAGSGVATATTGKRPLSSFIAGAGIARLSNEPTEPGSFRAGTTVASFQWPIVCRTLAQRCASQLNGVADLLVAQAQGGRSVIGVAGLSPGSGATTIAACLAGRLAGRGKRIILVDGNFARPQLATWFEVVPTAGWQEVLKHGAPLPDAVIRATDDRLDLLALGSKRVADPVGLVGGLQAVVTAGVLRHAYDLVLIDIGAFSDPAQHPVMLALVRNLGIDGVLAVAGASPGGSPQLATLVDHLARTGCELLGTIENRVAKTQAVSQESRVNSQEPEDSFQL